MSFVFANMNIIDLFQEAFNFLATFYNKIQGTHSPRFLLKTISYYFRKI